MFPGTWKVASRNNCIKYMCYMTNGKTILKNIGLIMSGHVAFEVGMAG